MHIFILRESLAVMKSNKNINSNYIRIILICHVQYEENGIKY
jgi:hypothetical protein